MPTLHAGSQATSAPGATQVPGLLRHWDFSANPTPWLRARRAVRARLGRCAPPRFHALVPVTSQTEWTVYFAFLPTGRPMPYHLHTLSRLRDMGLHVLLICASATDSEVPRELACLADAVYWKALSGYDFSAYSIALSAIADRSPGAKVFIMNDSVLGPFSDLRPFITSMPWDLTGMTASSLHENHIQSYAFMLSSVTPTMLSQLEQVFPLRFAYDRVRDVILCQELSFAAVASRTMSVGSNWFSDVTRIADPTLVVPFQLLDAGFPFCKRSLLHRHARFQDKERVEAWLHDQGHPPVGGDAA